MNKKLFIGLAPLLAIAGFAAMAVAAQAVEPHWYKNGAKIKESPIKVQTTSWGKVTATFSPAVIAPIQCNKADAGNVWDPEGGGAGLAETVVFALYECSTPECPFTTSVTSSGLPWQAALTEEAGVIREKTTGISLTVECIGPAEEVLAKVGPFTGELTPKIKNGTTAGKPSVDEFDGTSGALLSEIGPALTLIGPDKFFGFVEQEVVTANNP
jgi:hypothetical protein